jgi:hypothetical protein
MSRSLFARTRPEFYDEWAHSARRAHVPQEAVKRSIATEIHQAQALLDGKCPKCGAPSARYVHRGRQSSLSKMPGEWVMYRCSTQPPPGTLRPDDVCDFMVDFIEGEEAN